MSSSLQRRLEKLDTQDNKADEYSKVLKELFETESTANLTVFVDHLVKQNPISVRGVYKTLIDLVRKRRSDRNAASLVPWLEATVTTIAATGQQVLEETVNLLRFNLAKVYQHEMTDDPENFVKAVRHYAKMNLDNATPQLKVKAWVRAAQLCVADKLYSQAEQFTTKLGSFIKLGSNRAKIDEKYRRRYLSANASIQDFNNKFHVAASEYYRLSTLLTDQNECTDKLKAGLKCVLLAPGSSVLGQYYKDDRCTSLPGYNLVEKMFLERFIDSKEYEAFEKTLEEHQQRATKEGWSLLKKAVIEHNLIAASHVYTNIAMSNLTCAWSIKRRSRTNLIKNDYW